MLASYLHLKWSETTGGVLSLKTTEDLDHTEQLDFSWVHTRTQKQRKPALRYSIHCTHRGQYVADLLFTMKKKKVHTEQDASQAYSMCYDWFGNQQASVDPEKGLNGRGWARVTQVVNSFENIAGGEKWTSQGFSGQKPPLSQCCQERFLLHYLFLCLISSTPIFFLLLLHAFEISPQSELPLHICIFM